MQLSNGEYWVRTGVNWPHHVFVNHDFNVMAPSHIPRRANTIFYIANVAISTF